VEAKLEGKTLTLKIELHDGYVRFLCGKRMIVATTNGFTDVPGTNLRINFNITKSRKE
jgi:hypothetical protein